MSIPIGIKKKLDDAFTKSNENLQQFIIDIINRDDLLMAIMRNEDLNQYLDNYDQKEEMPEEKKLKAFPEWI